LEAGAPFLWRGMDQPPGKKDMPKPRTVILWSQNDLLAKAMEMVLTAGEAEAWNVIKLSANQCMSSLVEQVQSLKPDLVILYQAKPGDDSDCLSKLIWEQPDLKLIIVSLENNVMEVYSKRSVTVRHASDLLSVMEDRYFSENPSSKEVSITQKSNGIKSINKHGCPNVQKNEHRRN
jgi:hypothetical protein